MFSRFKADLTLKSIKLKLDEIRVHRGGGVGIFGTRSLPIGGSKGGMRDDPPPGIQILSISCGFRKNLAKS